MDHKLSDKHFGILRPSLLTFFFLVPISITSHLVSKLISKYAHMRKSLIVCFQLPVFSVIMMCRSLIYSNGVEVSWMYIPGKKSKYRIWLECTRFLCLWLWVSVARIRTSRHDLINVVPRTRTTLDPFNSVFLAFNNSDSTYRGFTKNRLELARS